MMFCAALFESSFMPGTSVPRLRRETEENFQGKLAVPRPTTCLFPSADNENGYALVILSKRNLLFPRKGTRYLAASDKGNESERLLHERGKITQRFPFDAASASFVQRGPCLNSLLVRR